ncbi:MAG: acyltransferase family protein [Lewinellaceae bacterium]|nr:acyltransferase family protein [Lewinellaceae bacterium]
MNSRGRITYIDFARGYAIFTIVCYHGLQRADLPGLWQKAIVFGGTGVHLFFLLSGFGLGLSGAGYRVADFLQAQADKGLASICTGFDNQCFSRFFFGIVP